jgi:dTDP-4-dehydrorhamnose reductase
MTKILITGGAGQLGQAFGEVAATIAPQLIICDRQTLDISSQTSIRDALAQYQPDIVINAAAYTAVDQAELEADKAFAINTEAAALLATECALAGVKLIHISTDYVFDGEKGVAYEVSDQTNPINVYGQSKLAGEKAVLATHLKAVIVRTAWLYSEFGDNFQTRIIHAAKARLAENQPLRVVDDQWGSPTYAPHLVQFLLQLITKLESYHGQVLHCSDGRVMSRFEQAQEILIKAVERGEIKKLPHIEAACTKDYPALAKRPINSALKASKLAS